jgi:carbon-monoxide dehydrogenase catalytic subunit
MMEDYGMRRDKFTLGKRTPQARQDLWEKTGVYPHGIDRENVEMLHRTHMVWIKTGSTSCCTPFAPA